MKYTARYPRHLARHVAAHMASAGVPCPPEQVVRALLETLYFTSLKTDEGRPCRLTVNYVDPSGGPPAETHGSSTDRWTCVPFERPLPFDVRTLAKLAEAVDPSVSSIAVFSDQNGRLYIWGLVDQELRYADYASLDSVAVPKRPGLFQIAVTGVGNISVYRDYSLIGSLEQNTLVPAYHDVLWSGPVHEMLKSQLHGAFGNYCRSDSLSPGCEATEWQTRWLNAVCRILLNIQRYRHGGGLLITPATSPPAANVKYRLRYDRLPKALARLVQHQARRDRMQAELAVRCRGRSGDKAPCRLHEDLVAHRRQLEDRKDEVLGCVRFIASLSQVDGFVMLDRSLVVHGFGVELRADSRLNEVWLAGDAHAQARWMRTTPLEEFGTRHRAMMRYCFEMPGTLGFVVSQDGDVRAVTRIRDKLVFWENVNVQLAFRVERDFAALPAGPVSKDLPLSDVA